MHPISSQPDKDVRCIQSSFLVKRYPFSSWYSTCPHHRGRLVSSRLVSSRLVSSYFVSSPVLGPFPQLRSAWRVGGLFPDHIGPGFIGPVHFTSLHDAPPCVGGTAGGTAPNSPRQIAAVAILVPGRPRLRPLPFQAIAVRRFSPAPGRSSSPDTGKPLCLSLIIAEAGEDGRWGRTLDRGRTLRCLFRGIAAARDSGLGLQARAGLDAGRILAELRRTVDMVLFT